jgi:hypothetical protein
MEDCLVCFLSYLFAPTFFSGAKRSESKFISCLSTYYLWIGLISFAALIYVCLYAAFGNEKPAYYFSWVAFMQYWNGFQDY